MKKEIIHSNLDLLSNFSSEISFPKHLICLQYNSYFIFRRRYYMIIKKKRFWKRTHPIHDFKRRLCAQTQ